MLSLEISGWTRNASGLPPRRWNRDLKRSKGVPKRGLRRSVVQNSFTRKTEEQQDLRQLRKAPLQERGVIRLGLPSKGRMAEDTLNLLKDCQLSVYKPNPRQYVATIPQMPGVEAWFQRASDVVRKLRYGDVDLGIVGYDMFCELADEDPDLVLIHEALEFGKCRLSLGVPFTGVYSAVTTLEVPAFQSAAPSQNDLQDLRTMKQWSETQPLRVVTGYSNIARKFFAEQKFEHVVLLSADGALEAAPAMGSADIILDLVSTGITLRENNLREVEGGQVLESQGVLVGNKRSLLGRKGLLRVVRELLDRLDAHLKAEGYFSVVANMKGPSPEDIAARLLHSPGLSGLEGPTISPVYPQSGSEESVFATCICVKKADLYGVVKELRKLGGSGVLVQPMTYIFDEESSRWKQLLQTLNTTEHDIQSLV